MELQELVDKMQAVFEADARNLGERIFSVLFSEQKDEVCSAYVDMVGGDLATDELQKIFQYYYADRKEKMQDYTPKSIEALCTAETRKDGSVVYDLCAGSGALTIQKWVQSPEKTFICKELDERVIPFLLFNMAVRNINRRLVR